MDALGVFRLTGDPLTNEEIDIRLRELASGTHFWAVCWLKLKAQAEFLTLPPEASRNR